MIRIGRVVTKTRPFVREAPCLQFVIEQGKLIAGMWRAVGMDCELSVIFERVG